MRWLRICDHTTSSVPIPSPYSVQLMMALMSHTKMPRRMTLCVTSTRADSIASIVARTARSAEISKFEWTVTAVSRLIYWCILAECRKIKVFLQSTAVWESGCQGANLYPQHGVVEVSATPLPHCFHLQLWSLKRGGYPFPAEWIGEICWKISTASCLETGTRTIQSSTVDSLIFRANKSHKEAIEQKVVQSSVWSWTTFYDRIVLVGLDHV